MPTYAYACKQCGHRFDAVQSFAEPALTACPVCSGPLRKEYGSIGVTFNGSGFYRTDSRADAAAGKKGGGSDSSSGSGDSGGKRSDKSSGGKSSDGGGSKGGGDGGGSASSSKSEAKASPASSGS